MKRFTLVFIFFSLTLSVCAQEINQKRIRLTEKFFKAVVAHNQSKVIRCMDKKYRKEQIEFLGGNKQQFVDELFGGTDLQTREFVNVKLEDIDAIELKYLEEYEYSGWGYILHVKSGDQTIEVMLDLLVRRRKYGFVGASG